MKWLKAGFLISKYLVSWHISFCLEDYNMIKRS